MPVAIDKIDQRVTGVAEPSGCPRDSAEDGLNVGRWA
jgi:hypothetical protein